MNNSYYVPNHDYKVIVRCLTYNQSKYIADALNGFAKQKTNFPFACVIMDDCSTDGEQEVIKTWMENECDMRHLDHKENDLADIYVLPHKTNKNCTFAFHFLKRNLWREPDLKDTFINPWRNRSIYEAICEGDDFWTSPTKLQKQYDALETRKECSICLNRVKSIVADTGEFFSYIPPIKAITDSVEVDMKEVARIEFKNNHWCFQTSSYFIRINKWEEYKNFKNNKLPNFPFGDMAVLMFYLQNGGFFINETMGCYRRMAGGWNSKMREDAAFKRKTELTVIEGYKIYDELSSYKYHSEIETCIRRKELAVLYRGWTLRPKYWKVMAINFTRRVKGCLRKFIRLLFPGLYKLINRFSMKI